MNVAIVCVHDQTRLIQPSLLYAEVVDDESER